jgi:hypothetical protein
LGFRPNVRFPVAAMDLIVRGQIIEHFTDNPPRV